MSPFALAGARVFDGEALHHGLAVVVADGRIRAVSEARVPGRRPGPASRGCSPGFIDIRSTAAGRAPQRPPDIDGVRTIAAAHRTYGTTGLLPTLVTDTRERMAEAIKRCGGPSAKASRHPRHPPRGPYLNRSGRASTIPA
jgi:N-acetylglucosamine-6-phosphate deacetylase